MNRLFRKLLNISYQNYRMKRRSQDQFLKEFKHDSFVFLNPEE